MKLFIKKYEEYMLQKGYSEKTVREYGQYTTYFSDWAKEKYQKDQPKDITRQEIYDFQTHLYNYKTKKDTPNLSDAS